MKNKGTFERLKSQVYCRLQPSEIHGIGVFAIKDIPLGVCPWSTPNHHYSGGTVQIPINELNRLSDDTREMLLDYNLLSKAGVFIHPKELEIFHMTQFLNGSKNPNLKLDPLTDTVFKTIKEIKKGEELIVDFHKCLEGTAFVYNFSY